MDDILIIGGGVTGLAAAYEARRQGLTVALVEAERRLGGKVLSERHGGCVLEAGPDAFIDTKPQALELAHELGLGDRLVASRGALSGIELVRRGRLHPLPAGFRGLLPTDLRSALRSPLLPWLARVRLLRERWIPPGAAIGDESLGAFLRRRFGREITEGLGEPLLAHLHAGDVDRLSLRATYPRLGELEARYGSLTAAGRAGAGSRGPGPGFWTLAGGLGELVDTLAGRLEPSALQLGRRAVELKPLPEGGFECGLDGGRRLRAHVVVASLPAFAAARLVEPWAAALAGQLRSIRYVSLASVSLAYDAQALPSPRGFGFFVPRRERRTVMAGTWSSTKFPGRAPPGTVLLRTFVGGAGHEGQLSLDDADLLHAVRSDVARLTGASARPVFERLHRWERGYPQYEVGHLERVAELERRLPAGLFLAGGAYGGVGLPDCIRQGREAAARAASWVVSRVGDERRDRVGV